MQKFIIIFCLITALSTTQGQTEKIFSTKNNMRMIVNIGGAKNYLATGNNLNAKLHFQKSLDANNTLFLGAESFVIKTDFSLEHPYISTQEKILLKGIGVTLNCLLKNLPHNSLADINITLGLAHVSQKATLLYTLAYNHQYIKFEQIQNDWLYYLESSLTINRAQRVFNKGILGVRYESQWQSQARGSLNGEEIIIPTANRKNYKIWAEIGMFGIVINPGWGLVINMGGLYQCFSQTSKVVYQIGPSLSIFNEKGEVIKLTYAKEFHATGYNSPPSLHYYTLGVDILNLGTGF